jgi:hypothetical protein
MKVFVAAAALGVDFAHGYHFGRAAPVAAQPS